MSIILESFENLAQTPNTPLSLEYGIYGFLQPGYLSAFTFASGLKLLAPVPNNQVDGGETLVGDFDIASGTWRLDENGKLDSADDLPGGSAYIGANKTSDGTLTFGFSEAAYTVKAFVTAVRDDDQRGAVTATAYDASGKVITVSRIIGSHVDDWDESAIAVQSRKPIAKIVFTGDFLILDNLSFDTAKPDVVKGSARNDKLGSAVGKDTSDGPEIILGRDGNDRAFGRDGGDTIDGGKGNDKLHGGDGDDTIVGGLGRDKLWGDEGQDSFLFRAPGGPDTIKDFDVAEDNIILDHAGFAQLPIGHVAAQAFNDGSAPITGDTRLIYDKDSGDVSYDSDGSGAAKAVLFAKVAPGLDLGSDNFFVV
jgi:Ca2+-binding RTX toxin-like protein